MKSLKTTWKGSASVLLGVALGMTSGIAYTATGPGDAETASMVDYAAAPPLIVEGADPLLMINLSVELTQQAESFTDGKQKYGETECPGRSSWNNLGEHGICFTSAEEYIGYFNPDKCYVYTTGSNTNPIQIPTGPRSDSDPDYFRPVADAVGRECAGGQFSGNFLNWSTMTALDQFRAAMTGGARLVDTAGANARTLLARTYRYSGGNEEWSYVNKVVSSATSGSLRARYNTTHHFITNISKVTPWNNAVAVRVENAFSNNGDSGHRTRFTAYKSDGSILGTYIYNVIVDVCNAAAGVEENCVRYGDDSGTWYKPEGLLQKNALKMRYALTSYTARAGNGIHGGVLRSEAKYIGPLRPGNGGGMEVNPYAEIAADGTYIFNPDKVSLGGGVVNSGILNYINQFGLAAGTYKRNDPVAELYYEGLRYLMGLQPTTAFHSPSPQLNDKEKDGYPVIKSWIEDPISSSCQQNFALYVGDQFAHHDDYLPGKSCNSTECNEAKAKGLDATEWTNLVGTREGYHSGNLANQVRSGNGEGWWIAGLAYWANTNDIRSDLEGFQRVKTFMVDTQEYKADPHKGRDNQLWLAAKYGGYDYDPDNPSNPDPSALSDPDAYTLASQPANLRAGLSRAFEDVIQATSSASAAAVVNNSVAGSGVIHQALYEPRLSIGNITVNWSGTVRGLFIDQDVRFREDTNGNGRLDTDDYVIEFYEDLVNEISLARRVAADGSVVESGIPVRDVRAIWDARQVLAQQPTDQRPAYGNGSLNASDGRYIYTWIDANGDGVVDEDEWRPFVADELNSIDNNSNSLDTARLLGLNSSNADVADDLVNYIRGIDKPELSWRSRQFDVDGDGVMETLRLGDVVHSSPLVVGAPEESFNISYRDATYAAFQRRYAQRRQMVYAGANDGMLHAFNGGFFKPALPGFTTDGPNNEVEHPLGSEMWAYVPYNLLPHLQWLKELDYPHIYYVDGPPQAFDVNIFNDCSAGSEETCTHPYGWGTILVVGFRFGGGDITVDVTADSGGEKRTFRSAYLVLDITDPEQPPTLLAEITHPDLGFTTSRPTVIKQRRATTGSDYSSVSKNDWYLVFGSGPAGNDKISKRSALLDATSNRQARLFAYKLNADSRGLVNLGGEGVAYQLVGDSNSFVGDLVAQDWDNDYQDDVVYFGTVSGTVSNPTGGLWRAVIGNGLPFTINRVLDSTDQPFSAAPLVTRDSVEGRPWIFAGSGRFFTSQDIRSAKNMSYYGITEPRSGDTFSYTTVSKASSLANTSDVMVFEGGSLADAVPGTPPGIPGNADNISQLQQEIRDKAGWYMDFSQLSERFVDRSMLIRNVVTFNGYVASGNSCEPAGYLNRYDLSMYTGTASMQNTIGTDPSVIQNGKEMIRKSQYLGRGMFFLSGIVRAADGSFKRIDQGSDGSSKVSGIGSGGSSNSRISWRELPLPAAIVD